MIVVYTFYGKYSSYMDTTQQDQQALRLIKQLTERVAALEQKLEEKQVQQIAFPLDRASAQIISKALGL